MTEEYYPTFKSAWERILALRSTGYRAGYYPTCATPESHAGHRVVWISEACPK